MTGWSRRNSSYTARLSGCFAIEMPTLRHALTRACFTVSNKTLASLSRLCRDQELTMEYRSSQN